MGKRYFDLSTRSHEQIARIIRAIPEEWCFLSGRLHAPTALVSAGKAHPHTGFVLDGLVHNTVKIGTKLLEPAPASGLPPPVPDVPPLVCGEVLPGFVAFERAGYLQGGVLSLAQAAAIAAEYVRRGYESSHLEFFVGDTGLRDQIAPAHARFHLLPWREFETLTVERLREPELRPMLELVWNPAKGGSEVMLQPLIVACEAEDAACVGDTPTGWASEQAAAEP